MDNVKLKVLLETLKVKCIYYNEYLKTCLCKDYIINEKIYKDSKTKCKGNIIKCELDEHTFTYSDIVTP